MIFKTDFAPGLGEPVGSGREDHKDEGRMHLAHKAERAVDLGLNTGRRGKLVSGSGITCDKVKDLALCGEDLFYSFFGYVLQ